MLAAARGYDKAFCCAHVGILAVSPDEVLNLGASIHQRWASSAPARHDNDESEVQHLVRAVLAGLAATNSHASCSPRPAGSEASAGALA